MAVNLPLELLHVILAILAENHRDLSPISLVSRAFLNISRKHRYAKVVINLPPTYPRKPNVIFCSSTRFARLPDLFLHGILEVIPPIFDNVTAIEVYTTDTTFPDEISTTFELLNNLESLHIIKLNYKGLDVDPIHWDSSEALALRSVICHSLRLPSFQELKIALGVKGFPFSILRGTSIKSLALRGVLLSVDEGSHWHDTIGLPPAALSELQIHSKSAVELETLFNASYPKNDPIIDIRGLMMLDISQASPACSSVLQSIFALARELRSVQLHVTDSTTIGGLASRLDPCLRTLSSLLVQVIILRGVDSSTDPILENYLGSLTSELQQIHRGAQALNKIVLTFKFTLPSRGQTDISKHWESLDELLSSWTSLQEVSIFVLPTDRGMANSIDLWKNLGKTKLTKLSENNKIRFRFHCFHLGLTFPAD